MRKGPRLSVESDKQQEMSNMIGDDNTEQANKKSILKGAQAEQRLNIRLDEILAMLIDEIFATAMHSLKKADVDAMKEKISERLLTPLSRRRKRYAPLSICVTTKLQSFRSCKESSEISERK